MSFTPMIDPPDGVAPGGPALVVAVHEGRSVFVVDDVAPDDGIFLGMLDGRSCYAVDVRDEADVDLDLFRDLRQQWGALDEATWTVAGAAAQLVDWQRDHRFCGRCATPTEPSRGERSRRCPRCGLAAFPRLAPAVIMRIERDDGRILLARNSRFPTPFFSLLAGFVEPGETLEQAVVRETFEEVGVTVGDVAYWGSQPWPFPHSLMVGFTARYLSGEFVLQADEIAESGWFAPDDLPTVPPRMSIAGRMIEDWAAASGRPASPAGSSASA
jgi:NAD+ diphosphatase